MASPERGAATAPEPGMRPVASAMLAAARFDRRMVSPAAGLLAAIPVVTVLGGGIALGDPVPAVTMGAGAMLVGVAWRATGGRPPLTVMAIDAAVMGLSTFVGCITGSVVWLHTLLLCAWSLMGGLLVGVGNRGGAVGIQAVIAFVVFGRFSQPAPAALGLAGLVLTGGLAQVVFLTLIRWPPPLRSQRAATANAFRELALFARATDDASALAPAAALDDAEATLGSPALFGDAALMTLRTLVSEGYRLRVQVIAVHVLLRQQEGAAEPGGNEVDAAARAALELTATALEQAAEAIEGDPLAATRLGHTVAELDAALDALDALDTFDAAAALHLSRRLAAVAGQLRAVSTLAPAAGAGGGLRSRRPVARANRPRERVRAQLSQLRANMSPHSPAGRHAVRLAVIVPAASLLAHVLPLQRSYWMVVAAATVLRPEYGATFTRGTERQLGTALGVALAGAITVVLHPAGGVVVVLVGLLAWAGFAVFPASWAVGFGFITALVVFLLDAVSHETLATASARLLDTIVGGAIGLAAYVLWPTWSHTPAWQSLADLVSAQRAYIDAVLSALADGRHANAQLITRLSRQARLARTAAEATVARSLSEPATRRIDARESQGALGALRRLIRTAHVLRLDAQDAPEPQPIPELAPLRDALSRLLTSVEETMRARPDAPAESPPLPDLRARYRALKRARAGDPDAAGLLTELDELVDAANGLAAQVGSDPVDAEPDPPGWRVLGGWRPNQWLPRRS